MTFLFLSHGLPLEWLFHYFLRGLLIFPFLNLQQFPLSLSCFHFFIPQFVGVPISVSCALHHSLIPLFVAISLSLVPSSFLRPFPCPSRHTFIPLHSSHHRPFLYNDALVPRLNHFFFSLSSSAFFPLVSVIRCTQGRTEQASLSLWSPRRRAIRSLDTAADCPILALQGGLGRKGSQR